MPMCGNMIEHTCAQSLDTMYYFAYGLGEAFHMSAFGGLNKKESLKLQT